MSDCDNCEKITKLRSRVKDEFYHGKEVETRSRKTIAGLVDDINNRNFEIGYLKRENEETLKAILHYQKELDGKNNEIEKLKQKIKAMKFMLKKVVVEEYSLDELRDYEIRYLLGQYQ